MKINLIRIVTRVLVVAAVAGTTTAAAVQSGPDLATLTVPQDQLPPGCRIKPAVPKAPIGAQPNVVVFSRESGPPVPSNPWKGEDRRIAADIRRLIDGSPAEPDGPLLDAKGAATFALRWADNVVEAYEARYLSGDDTTIDVYAIRFNDERLATPAPPPGTKNVARGATIRVVLGPTVVLVAAGTTSNCFQAVSEYVRSLR